VTTLLELARWDGASQLIELAILRDDHGRFASGGGISAGHADKLRKRGFGEGDIKVISSHRAAGAAKSAREMPASPGTHEHAQELRAMARRSDAAQSGNVSTSRVHPGGADNADMRRSGGLMRNDEAPSSNTSSALRRAADMIDRGQPSLAREHAPALRDAARQELRAGSMRPDYARQLNATAAKLEKLPAGKGLAAQPKETAEAARRTLAARAYAAKSVI
jgi:hypothetical protein